MLRYVREKINDISVKYFTVLQVIHMFLLTIYFEKTKNYH